MQLAAVDLLGAGRAPGYLASRRPRTTYGGGLPAEVQGMLRSRANTIEGGTTEVNKNVIAERVLGLPGSPTPTGAPWRDVPRS